MSPHFPHCSPLPCTPSTFNLHPGLLIKCNSLANFVANSFDLCHLAWPWDGSITVRYWSTCTDTAKSRETISCYILVVECPMFLLIWSAKRHKLMVCTSWLLQKTDIWHAYWLFTSICFSCCLTESRFSLFIFRDINKVKILTIFWNMYFKHVFLDCFCHLVCLRDIREPRHLNIYVFNSVIFSLMTFISNCSSV